MTTQIEKGAAPGVVGRKVEVVMQTANEAWVRRTDVRILTVMIDGKCVVAYNADRGLTVREGADE